MTTGMVATAGGSSPAAATTSAGTAAASGTADCDSVTTCYTPQQIRVAYGIKPLVDQRIDGRGQTVVLPEPLVRTSCSPGSGMDRAGARPGRTLVDTACAAAVYCPS